MKQKSAAVLLISMLAGCGGGGGGGDSPTPRDNNDHTPVPQSTPVGSVIGAAVSAVIGSEGGQLQSADGSLTLLVPPGALDADTTVSIQPISNQALGGVGTAFRIGPEGLHSLLPMTLEFHPDATDLAGSALRFVSIAFQDAAGHWRVFDAPLHDEVSASVAIQTSHFSDWSMVAGVQLRPGEASVKTGANVPLAIRLCETGAVESENPEDANQSMMFECSIAPLTSFSAARWSVNGVEGGAGDTGTVVANTDKSTGEAIYSAPDKVPDSNPVAVSVEVLDFDNPADKTWLVSNITITEDVSCEALKNVETIEAAIAYADFEWTDSSDSQSYEGHQSGRLLSTMINQIPVLGRDVSPIGYWTSQNQPHTGLVTMNDTRKLFYPDETITEQAVGAGLPYTGNDVPSFISLIVDYATCEYELAAAFVVMGTVTSDGVSAEVAVAPGAIYYRELLPAALFTDGVIERDELLPARYDTGDKQSGYYPAGQNDQLRATGSTMGYWRLSIGD